MWNSHYVKYRHSKSEYIWIFCEQISAHFWHSSNVLPRVIHVHMPGLIKSCRKHVLDGFCNLVRQRQLPMDIISRQIDGKHTHFDLLCDAHSKTICLFTECKLRCSMQEFKMMGCTYFHVNQIHLICYRLADHDMRRSSLTSIESVVWDIVIIIVHDRV